MPSSACLFRLALCLLCLLCTTPGAAAQCLESYDLTDAGIDDTVLPINELGSGLYKGVTGGLYPGGVNAPPVSHRQNIIEVVRQITPGGPDGLIGFLSIGFSNPTQEYGAFAYDEAQNPDRNASIVLVSAAQGGQDIDKTIDVDADNMNDYWLNVEAKVAAAGLTPEQVQVAWIKTTMREETSDFLFERDRFRGKLVTLMNLLRSHYPELRLAYLSSRIFSGFARVSSEPQDYEEAFAIKALIEDQINETDPGLDYRTGASPLVLWGPYLWANADRQANNGLIWCPEDFEEDGLNKHPNDVGELKFADELSRFFSTERTTSRWWRKQPDRALVAFPASADTYVTDDSATGCSTLDQGSEPYLYTLLGTTRQTRSFLRFDVSGESRPVVRALLRLRVHPEEEIETGEPLSAKGGMVYAVTDAAAAWAENSFTWCTQPDIDPSLAFHLPDGHSRGSFITLDVTAAYRQDTDGVLSFRIDSDQIGDAVAHGYMAREKDPARPRAYPALLTLIVDETAPRMAATPPRMTAGRAESAPSPDELTVYPEPFNPRTTISFTLAAMQPVDLSVFDLTGRRVARLASEMLPAGTHRYAFDASRLASGVYLVRLLTADGITSHPITLIR